MSDSNVRQSSKPPRLLIRLRKYVGNLKGYLSLAGIVAFIANILALVPILIVWDILSGLFSGVEREGSVILTKAIWALVVAVAYLVLYFLALMLAHRVAFRIENSIRYQSMRRAMRMPLGFYDTHPTGKLRNVMDDNASLIHAYIAHQYPDLWGGMAILLSLFLLIFIPDWRMGLATLIPIVFSFMAMGMMMRSSEYRDGMTQYMNHLEKMNSQAVEFVRGMPVVKTFQQSVYSFNRFHKAIKDYHLWVTRYAVSACNNMTIYSVLINGFAFLLIPLAVYFIVVRGEPVGEVLPNLVFYMLLTPLYGQSMMKLMYVVSGKRMAEQAVDRVEQLFQGEEELAGERELSVMDYSIGLHNVSFCYAEDAPKALDNITLSIPEGKKYALVGASGSGKTTLARLVARFWDPQQGSVTIGGINLATCTPRSIHEKVSFVFQNEKLFKTSIRENITYGNPKASEEEIMRAVRLAQCEELVAKLPDGIDTKLGKKGIYLSGGEQQRIALARAFLKDAPIILLDEATAFADPENEREIQQALRELMKQKTVLMIAHRLSSVVDADRIIVLEKGTISEEGTHQELLEQGGLYTRMWNEYKEATSWTI